jgi:hypothetical protein
MSDPSPVGATPDGLDPAALLAFDLADRLRKALRIGKCKPGEMRAILGVSESTMTNYLDGSTRPKDGMLRQWALRCAAPVTFEWLRTGTTAGPEGGGDQQLSQRACHGEVIDLGARRAKATADSARSEVIAA